MCPAHFSWRRSGEWTGEMFLNTSANHSFLRADVADVFQQWPFQGASSSGVFVFMSSKAKPFDGLGQCCNNSVGENRLLTYPCKNQAPPELLCMPLSLVCELHL